MLFGGGGAKPAEGGGDKKDGGFNMGNMMEGLKKANEIGQRTKDLQKVCTGIGGNMIMCPVSWHVWTQSRHFS